MIAIDGVSKIFGDRRALDAISFDVARGEILAILGHNGAGKTTLFALMLGLLRLSAGDIVVDSVSVRAQPREARRRIGSVVAPAFYEYLSGWDNLRILASYSAPVAHAELAAAARFVGLTDRLHDRVRVYSHGMRRRLALAQALVPRPAVLLLDEWETGLDPEGVRDMRALILRLNQEHGITIVLTSHQPAGLDGLCERIAIMRDGRLLFVGPWRDLDTGAPAVRLAVDDWMRARDAMRALGASIGANGVVTLPTGGAIADLVAALVGCGVRVESVEPVRANVEELYFRALQTPITDRRPT
ncbi:MAG: ABC transporter ATP-binding protein [Candidatus Binatia bacterium]